MGVSRPHRWRLRRQHRFSTVLHSPSVWTGRALQAKNDDAENDWSCASVSGLYGTVTFLAIMDIRARSISFTSRPRRPEGLPDHERAGETFSPSPHSDSQTSAGKPTLALGSAKAVPSEPPSLARPIWRATGAMGGGGHPLGESERVHQAAALVTRAS